MGAWLGEGLLAGWTPACSPMYQHLDTPFTVLGCATPPPTQQMAQLVTEKDSGLRQAMRTMGLMDSSYWGSWVVFDLVFGTLLTLVIIFSGGGAWEGLGCARGTPWDLHGGRHVEPA